MFAKAYKTCAAFTRPVVIPMLLGDGQCTASIGTFIHLNNQGWIITSAHIVALNNQLLSQAQFVKAAEDEIAALATREETPEISARIEELRNAVGRSVREFSFWWAYDGAVLNDVSVLPSADLAVGRLDPFDPAWVESYPVIKNPDKDVDPGTYICRLGYPFADLRPSFVDGRFSVPPDVYTMPRFPNEGIITRHVDAGKHPVHGYPLGFLETSTPGLKGQSGGPIFDEHGTVWAIQSHTSHLDLGFAPNVPGGKTGEVEHQFLNVGRGSHPASIVGLLRELGVSFNLSEY